MKIETFRNYTMHCWKFNVFIGSFKTVRRISVASNTIQTIDKLSHYFNVVLMSKENYVYHTEHFTRTDMANYDKHKILCLTTIG